MNIERIISVLKHEKVIVAPSDTVLGLSGLCTEKVYDKLDEIKDRKNKPYLVLVSSLDEVKTIAKVSDQHRKLLEKFWPGPLTVILPAKDTAPSSMISSEGKIAVRVPGNRNMLKILAVTGPLFSTSANVGGEPIPESYGDLSSRLIGLVDAVFVEDDVSYPVVSSTIIDCSGDEIVWIREGIIPFSEVKNNFK